MKEDNRLKTALVFLGGEEYEGEIDFKGKFVIACDKAYDFVKKKGITPDLVLGDFDSLGYVPENAEVYPKEKDYTDFELAIEDMKKLGISRAVVYCGGGGREDHFLANTGIAVRAYEEGIFIEFITNYSRFFIAENRVVVPARKGTTISVIPLFKAKITKSENLKYPYRNVSFGFDSSLGISNVALEDNPSLEISEGKVFILIDNGREV